MKISVIIPVYNNAKEIERCIESVIRQEKYVGIDVEVILINDNSTDNLEEKINLLRYREIINDNNFIYIKNEKNIGPAESRNKGILRATGEYIAFLDSDDFWYDMKLYKQAYLIHQYGAILTYTSRRNVFYEEDKIVRYKDLEVPEVLTYEDLLKGNQITCSSVVVKTDIARKYLMKNDDIHEDYYMWLRILKDYDKAWGVNEPLVEYMVRKDSRSGNKIKSAIKTFKTLRMMKEPFFKCCYCFICYMMAGIKKYKKDTKYKLYK